MASLLGVGFCIFSALFLLPDTSVAMSYKGFRLFSVRAATASQTKEVLDLEDPVAGVSVVDEEHHGKVTLVAPPEKVDELSSKVKSRGLEMTLSDVDVQSLIDATTTRAAGPVDKRAVDLGDTAIVDHQMYHPYSAIVEMLEELAQLNPDIMEIKDLPFKSHEGRTVKLVKLHGKSTTTEGDQLKPAVVIEAGIHAREWISPAVNLWSIENFLQGYRSGHRTISEMLDKLDWYIIPVTNPDGYEYSHVEDRLWRKNRRYISRECRGVDLNRNFDVAFNTTGISNDCKSGVYLGHKAFSEPETSNVKALVERLKDRLVAYVSVHSYSQLILLPWGYSIEPSLPKNFKEMDRIATLMQAAIRIRHGTIYQKGQPAQILGYAASGAAEDWALQTVPGIFATCIELRPALGHGVGFLLPPDQIIPTAEEFFDGLAVMAKEVAKKSK